ncbi:jg15061 [Pararge aegeria aegeria]|uniref:Jg15061 protein n=1 Tax=Pararge aegeria aegeria TaxID=348720 RepID=A0A8S4SQE2_9NEOP|nr:jg15061 [Pararge aegeria aegeria]
MKLELEHCGRRPVPYSMPLEWKLLYYEFQTTRGCHQQTQGLGFGKDSSSRRRIRLTTTLANVSDGEMMETAESQNPFLPRFAMKKLKERREKAQAQRRNYQAQRRYQPTRSQVRCSHYKK